MRDVYLQLTNPDIKGESLDSLHPEWIEVENFHHAIYQPVSGTASTAGQ